MKLQPTPQIMKNENINTKNQITRKEALSKMGRYAALTTIGTFLILNPRKSQALSLANPTTNSDEIFDD